MQLDSNSRLYILPFDHRHSYGAEVFGFHEPMSQEQIAIVAASKQVIYEGFQLALAGGVSPERAGILVDEEFGAAILRDSVKNGYNTAMPIEKSGQHEFDFEFGDYTKHIEAVNPTFVKVLVRFNPEGDAVENKLQAELLKQASDYCRQVGRLFMFELLVPPEQAQLAKVQGDKHVYDLEMRPGLMIRAIKDLQTAGIEPDIWKIEGLDRREDCIEVVAAAQAAGRDHVGCIVLGRGEDEQKVLLWLRTAATVPGFIGFAVGRSTFLEPIVALRAGKLAPAAASKEVARRFREWIDVFEAASKGRK
jgi:myo-inositol catabolism protein IolC